MDDIELAEIQNMSDGPTIILIIILIIVVSLGIAMVSGNNRNDEKID